MPERTPPAITDSYSRGYWDGLRKHRLLLQHCSDCGFIRFPAGAVCPECWSDRFDWRQHSGAGTVTSFVWYMKSLDRRFPEVPYNVSLIRLDDGPVIISNVMEVDFSKLHIGDRVNARFSDENAGFTALLFVRPKDS